MLPTSRGARKGAVLSYKNLVKLLTAAGRLKEAEQVQQRAIAFYEKLAAERPAEPYFREELEKRQAELAKLKDKR